MARSERRRLPDRPRVGSILIAGMVVVAAAGAIAAVTDGVVDLAALGDLHWSGHVTDGKGRSNARGDGGALLMALSLFLIPAAVLAMVLGWHFERGGVMFVGVALLGLALAVVCCAWWLISAPRHQSH